MQYLMHFYQANEAVFASVDYSLGAESRCSTVNVHHRSRTFLQHHMEGARYREQFLVVTNHNLGTR
jgi:hypothetical protein